MPDPDYKALCAELLADYDNCHYRSELSDRARAALAQPESAPTDEELMAAARKAVDTYLRGSELPYFLHEDSSEYEPMLLALRSAACWGTPAIQPEPVAPTDAEIEQWADAAKEVPLEEMDPEVHGWRRCFTAKEFSETIRAAIARWGTPANNIREENLGG